uniref:Uncharacterized protein n=1 Tax=Rhizophora mucronata TaxID=61149 RepID=A0A2P2KXC7_RHIMU
MMLWLGNQSYPCVPNSLSYCYLIPNLVSDGAEFSWNL